MNTKNLSIKMSAALSLLILVMMGLVGCGTLEIGALPADAASVNNDDPVEPEESQVIGIEIGIEPTPMPDTLTYTNAFYGFKFDYPETWTLTEIDHGVILMQDNNRLTINFRWANEVIAPFRTGMAAGTPIYSDKISLMGQVVPVYIVELDHLAKYVLYGEDGMIQVDDLVLTSVLEDLETDYMTLDLPEMIVAEATLIMGSFERIEATGSNPIDEPTLPEDGSLYKNQVYGFSFSYPSFMTLVEVPNKVTLTYDGNIQLTIAYRRSDENINISGISEAPDKLVPYGEVQFLGEPVDVILDTQDGQTKFVYLGIPGMELGESSPLRFVISLSNINGGGISNAQTDSMLKVFENFAVTNSSNTVDWQTAVEIINAEQVIEVFQTHNLEVTLTLADGSQIKTVEPSIDAIFREIELCGDICSNIVLITE